MAIPCGGYESKISVLGSGEVTRIELKNVAYQTKKTRVLAPVYTTIGWQLRHGYSLNRVKKVRVTIATAHVTQPQTNTVLESTWDDNMRLRKQLESALEDFF